MENMTLNISEVSFKQAVVSILASFPIFEKESDSPCWCREPEALRQLFSTNVSKGVSLAVRIRCKLTYTEYLSSAMICASHYTFTITKLPLWIKVHIDCSSLGSLLIGRIKLV